MKSKNRPRLGSVAPAIAAFLLLGACSGDSGREAEVAPPAISEAQVKADEARARLNGSEGGKLMLRAIEAHGGLEAWYGAATSSYTWEYSNTGMNLRFKTYLVADNSTRRIYHEFRSMGLPDDPKPFEGRFAWDGEKAWISPASVKQPSPRFWAATGYYFEQIPFVLADPGVSYELLPSEELDGVPHEMVKASFGPGVGDAPGDTYTLYVNQDNGLVDAIRYTVTYGRTPEQAKGRPETLFYYKDYVTVDGLTVPTKFEGFQFADGKKGEYKSEAWADEISFSRPFDESQLAMPADARVDLMRE